MVSYGIAKARAMANRTDWNERTEITKAVITWVDDEYEYDLEIENEYGLRRFIEAVYPNWDNRCATCYALRFEETARYAAEHGYDQFTSTLFVSPYQNHELMRQICEQMAEKYGVKYLHRDFSPRFREGQDKARELGLYMQNYCGCVFSEEDRYRKRRKKKQPADAQA